MIRYTIKPGKSEIEELESIVSKGSHKSQTYRVVYILINVDEGDYSRKISNERICEVLRIGMRTVERVKKSFVEEGIEACLEHTKEGVSKVRTLFLWLTGKTLCFHA